MTFLVRQANLRDVRDIVLLQQRVLAEGILARLPQGTQYRFFTWLIGHIDTRTWVAETPSGEVVGFITTTRFDLRPPFRISAEMAMGTLFFLVKNPNEWRIARYHIMRRIFPNASTRREIVSFAVDERFQPQSLGAWLWRRAIAEETTRGCRIFHLSTHNRYLLNFYKRALSATVLGCHNLGSYKVYDLEFEVALSNGGSKTL